MPERPKQVLDPVREAVQRKHYSPRTEESYAGWIKRFILFHDKRHLRKRSSPLDSCLLRLHCGRDARGHALVVQNGKARERKLTLGVGSIKLRAPRVNDRREGQRFRSQILPPYMRRSPQKEYAPHLVALVRAGVQFQDGAQVIPFREQEHEIVAELLAGIAA